MKHTSPPEPSPTSASSICTGNSCSTRDSWKKGSPPTMREMFDEFKDFMSSCPHKLHLSSRSSAREKLTRLTVQQFGELTTDVYDELVRRRHSKDVLFLPIREDYHPKRNQARQKLATLPLNRFEDLSSDVYYEMSRRYPELVGEISGARFSITSYSDDPPPPYTAVAAPF
ncbi:hypothetical protein AX16_005438 [Volvariella volvacea WC 439]|nr:hypothetical protein AX16_005438 [Volvariella volvacea WC 439]